MKESKRRKGKEGEGNKGGKPDCKGEQNFENLN